MVEAVTKQHSAPPGFPLLADVGHKVIDRYGILNPELFQGQSRDIRLFSLLIDPEK